MSGTIETTVVVGGAGGIGAATAQRLAHEPWTQRLLLADIDAPRAEAHAARLRDQGVDAIAEHVDVSDERSLTTLVDSAGLVNAVAIVAGILSPVPSMEVTAGDFERVLRVNLI